MTVSLVRHLGKRLVVAERGELVERTPALLLVILPAALDCLEVRGDGFLSVHQGNIAVVGSPEVHDIGGEDARGFLDAHQRRI